MEPMRTFTGGVLLPLVSTAATSEAWTGSIAFALARNPPAPGRMRQPAFATPGPQGAEEVPLRPHSARRAHDRQMRDAVREGSSAGAAARTRLPCARRPRGGRGAARAGCIDDLGARNGGPQQTGPNPPNTNPSQAPASAVAPAHCNVTQCWPVQRGRGRGGGGRMRRGGPATPHSSWCRRRRWRRDDGGASCLGGVAPVARQYAAPVAGVGAGLPPLPRSAAAVARTERGSGRRPAGRLDRQAQQAASPSLRHAIQASAAGGSRVTRHARRQQVRCRRAGGCTASTALCRLLQTPARGFSEHVSNS